MTNTTNNAFTAFLDNTQEKFQQTQTQASAPSAPSEKQTALYKDLCARRNIEPDAETLGNRRMMSSAIESMMNGPMPPSARQMEKIKELIEQLTNAGVAVKISDEKLASLTGGQQGTASKLIEFLLMKRRESGVEDAISDKQVEIITEWFLCPDMPFEDYRIVKRVPLPHISEGAWRLCTAEEFSMQIRENMNREQASKFIDDHRATFYEWKKTRITQNQMRFIKTLEERLANTYTPSEATFAVDADGEIVEVASRAHQRYAPVGHEPLTDLQIAQMSDKEASQYIAQLQSALRDTKAVSTYNEHQQQLAEKHSRWNELRQSGTRAVDMMGARIKEYHMLNDVLFAIDSITGYENYELHEMLSELIIEGNSDLAYEFDMKLENYMLSTIEGRTFRRDMERLRTICEESDLATEVLEGALNTL